VLHLDNIAAHALSPGAARQVIATENLLILAANPGDETLFCGDLIAWCCARGRPPFVMVLADGQEAAPGCSPEESDAQANRRANDMLAALALLGLPAARVLLAGLACGKVPRAGPVFAAAVRAVRLVMWARDCNAILAPWPGLAVPDSEATSLIATQVAIETGVAWLEYRAPKT
jgi:LmbE family N-acetylglucosaminyl deacetylase